MKQERGFIILSLGLVALASVGMATANTQDYVKVEAGDTYKSIAESYNVSISELETMNNREVGGFDIIYPDDNVVIPTRSQEATQATNNTTEYNYTQSEQTTTQEQPRSQTAGTFKISYYDPAVLGSNMGYGGVAANLSVFPKGTQLLITLSNGTSYTRVVNDTGTFAYDNPQQLDVAMPNNMIPASGIDTATVQVIG